MRGIAPPSHFWPGWSLLIDLENSFYLKNTFELNRERSIEKDKGEGRFLNEGNKGGEVGFSRAIEEGLDTKKSEGGLSSI